VSEVILHHYDLSPYARKVRRVLGFKGIPWRSVEIPIVMPKPDLTELTGGYRRTPVMQIGADIYCDTKRCLMELERRHPEPSLFPDGDEASVWGLALWAETSFMMAVSVFLGVGGLFDEAFVEDRKKMVPDVDFSRAPQIVPAKLLQLRANLDRLERQLADGRPFLMGDRACLADFAAWHPHAFLDAVPATAALLHGLDRVAAWLERVDGFGDGARSEIGADEAIAVARDAAPAAIEDGPAPLPDGLAVGDTVAVVPEESGSGIVMGELLATGVHEIAIRRSSERAGELVVPFPRQEYLVLRAR